MNNPPLFIPAPNDSQIISNTNLKGNSSIDWDNYNYPVCLNLFHFDIRELTGPIRSLMIKLIWAHWLIMIYCGVNCSFYKY